MTIKLLKFRTVMTAIALLCFCSGPLAAQTSGLRDEDELLRLLADSDPANAAHVDRQLQALWEKTGSPSMDMLMKRGRDAMDVENYRTAIEHLSALTDHAPDFAEGWRLRASAFFEVGRYGPAIADLEIALALNPRNYNTILDLGTILELFGDEKRAYAAYERAQAIHPHHKGISKAMERLKPRVAGQAL
ncbi:MAG: tetratricopeptide repeat protein [Rhodobacteraceae bacterium]|nr:tetratricopeptide repeat protein [Paracoccaceae bacterium]